MAAHKRLCLAVLIKLVLEVVEVPEAFEVGLIVPLQLHLEFLILVHESRAVATTSPC